MKSPLLLLDHLAYNVLYSRTFASIVPDELIRAVFPIFSRTRGAAIIERQRGAWML